MTNKQLKKFFWQFTIYGGVLSYLAADLFLFHGPIAKKLAAKDPTSAESISAAKARGVAAQVYNHYITLSQVERAAHERLWRLGQDYDSLSEKQRQLVRYAALDDLIDHALLRVKASVHADKLILDAADIDARVERFKRRFPDDEARRKAMRSQGIQSEEDLRDRIAAQMQQEAYIELKIAPLSEVSEEQAREWFDQSQQAIANPELRRLRHIFLPSLEKRKEDELPKLEVAKAALARRETDFATLAKEISQDPATNLIGGELGFVHRERLPEDFADAVWQLPPQQPTIVESKIGWHLVEVLAIQPTQSRTFEQARDEIMTAIRNVKRREAIKEYRHALRRFESHRITIYHDIMR